MRFVGVGAGRRDVGQAGALTVRRVFINDGVGDMAKLSGAQAGS